jgi:hypothetical protein
MTVDLYREKKKIGSYADEVEAEKAMVQYNKDHPSPKIDAHGKPVMRARWRILPAGKAFD